MLQRLHLQRLYYFTIAVSLASAPASAHPGHGGDALSGLVHPFSGLDHIVAMCAVGLWGQ